MALFKSRVPFNFQNPYRPVRPITSKIIFLSFEGSVTEEEYFERVSDLFSEIKSKIQFISVAEDAVHTASKNWTPEHIEMITKARPKQLVERIDQFKVEKNNIYQFADYPEDEFWIVTDVDQNWSNDIINATENKTYLDEWNEAITMCNERGYGYAISNPFFEIWLLLHHDEASDEDKSYAVTDTHAYEKTNHFRTRLNELGVRLRDKKHIRDLDYDVEKVKNAIIRAEKLHLDKENLSPKYFATTVYILLNKMMEMLPKDNVENL